MKRLKALRRARRALARAMCVCDSAEFWLNRNQPEMANELQRVADRYARKARNNLALVERYTPAYDPFGKLPSDESYDRTDWPETLP